MPLTCSPAPHSHVLEEMMTTFDEMADRFTMRVERARRWRDSYFGAAYSTRIEAAIKELREAIAEAEQHPEIDRPER